MVVIDVNPIRERFSAVAPFLDERGRRLVAAAEAFAAGYGGIAAVAAATGIAPSTIGRGLKELAQDEPSERIRRPGAGRKPTLSKDPTLLSDLEALVEPTTRGDPGTPLRWTCKSVRRLAQALQAQGHEVSRTLVGHVLNEAGYSLQGNRKTTEGDSHPDRGAQFAYINTQVAVAVAEQQPAISIDTKKKELVGDFRNNGREYRPQGTPEEVRVHDFLIKELGRAVPYGVYDLAANSGWVSVGVDHDTAAFAVNSIRQWWQAVGRIRYPDATRLLITADGGGSNGSRVRLWKRELQKLANELGLDLPPGTSKWNKIEHRLFSSSISRPAALRVPKARGHDGICYYRNVANLFFSNCLQSGCQSGCIERVPACFKIGYPTLALLCNILQVLGVGPIRLLGLPCRCDVSLEVLDRTFPVSCQNTGQPSAIAYHSLFWVP